MATAAMMNTVRQPRVAATIPLTTRAISTPIIRPLITVPTARPRCCSAARDAAIGTMIWAATVVTPTTASALPSAAISGAAAAAASAADVTTIILVMSRRRSHTSPSGTRKARPAAYPTWPAVTSSPAVEPGTPNEVPIVCSKGCA